MAMTTLDLEGKNRLLFLGEGNEHIVFALTQSDCVLRFRKFPLEETIRREEFMCRVSSDLAFVNEVARPLAGPLLVDEARLVAVDSRLLEKVVEKIRPLRDEKRLCKVINEFGIAIMTPNVVTEFVERRSNFEISPTILNFSLRADTVTIFSSLFLFSKEPLMINDLSHISKSDKISTDIIGPLKSSTFEHFCQNRQQNFQESCFDESQKAVEQSASKESLISRTLESSKNDTESPYPKSVETLVSSTSPKVDKEDKATKESDYNQKKEEPKRRSETLKEEKSENERGDPKFSQDPRPQLLCIELKPKQGFLELGPGGHLLCRFCLKQHQKVASKTEAFRSSYCPGDLFSGVPSLMASALQNLFSAPQNNLKIFVDGSRVRNLDKYRYLSQLILRILTYDTDDIDDKLTNSPFALKRESNFQNALTQTDRFPSPQPLNVDLQSQALGSITHPRSDSNSPEISLDRKSVKKANRASLIPVLPEESLLSPGSFLGKILHLQGLGQLPEVHAGDLYREAAKRISEKDALHQLLADFKFLQNKAQDIILYHVSEYEEYPNSTLEGEAGHSHFELPKQTGLFLKGVKRFKGFISDLDTPTICQLLQQCLIAMSAKDASLMILIEGPHDRRSIPTHSQLLSTKSPFWLEFPSSSNRWYKCQVSVVDVALKTPQTILDHEEKLRKLENILIKLKSLDSIPFCCGARKRKVNWEEEVGGDLE